MEFLGIMYSPHIHFAYGPYYTNLAYPKGIYACFKIDICKTYYMLWQPLDTKSNSSTTSKSLSRNI